MSKQQQLMTNTAIKPATSIRIATYNINFGGSNWQITNPKATLNAIIAINADVMLLQEDTPAWANYFKKHLQKRYPYQGFKDYPKAGGLGILSKYPYTTIYYDSSHIGWHPAWIYLIRTPHGIMQIMNIHLTPPLVGMTSMGFLFHAIITTRNIRLLEMQHYYAFLKPNYPTIIAGDYNESELCQARIWLLRKGFLDAQTEMHNQQISWHWRKGIFTFTGRYDRILFTKADFQVQSFGILYAGDSDHYPVYTDLRFTEAT